jgi:hypothetical protein
MYEKVKVVWHLETVLAMPMYVFCVHQEDLRNTLAVVREFHAGSAVIWGSSKDTNSQQKCIALEHYLETVLGPTIMDLSAGMPEAQIQKI